MDFRRRKANPSGTLTTPLMNPAAVSSSAGLPRIRLAFRSGWQDWSNSWRNPFVCRLGIRVLATPGQQPAFRLGVGCAGGFSPDWSGFENLHGPSHPKLPQVLQLGVRSLTQPCEIKLAVHLLQLGSVARQYFHQGRAESASATQPKNHDRMLRAIR